jgi:4-amino-4-deoxy-L-arabinose transferase-like glycosyltransferase
MKFKQFYVVLLILTIVTRAGYMLIFGGIDHRLHDSMSDQYIYIDIGQNLAAGKGFVTSDDTFIADAGKLTSISPPLYPYFLAGVFSIFGKNLIAVRLIHILLSFVVVAVTYWLGKELFSENNGRISGILVAVHPAYIMYIRPIMSENIFFALVALMALTAYWILKYPKKYSHYFAFGFISGLGFLTRTEALVGMAVLLAYIAFTQLLEKRLQWVQLGLACAVFGILLVPVTIFNYQVHGNISPFPNKRWNVWNFNWWDQMKYTPEWQDVERPERLVVPDYEQKTELERDQYLYHTGIEWIRANPEMFVYNRFKYFHYAYPILPRELLPPPIGTSDYSDPPDGYLYGPSSLDDVVHYLTPLEMLRAWVFRLLLILSIPAVYLLIKNREKKRLVLLVLLLWNITHVFLLVGLERFRYQVEWISVILAVYSISYLTAKLRKDLPQGAEISM